MGQRPGLRSTTLARPQPGLRRRTGLASLVLVDLLAALLTAVAPVAPAGADGNEAPGAPGAPGAPLAARSISAGESPFTCALLDNATVKCWGAGTSRRLGQDSTTNLGDAAGEMAPFNRSTWGSVRRARHRCRHVRQHRHGRRRPHVDCTHTATAAEIAGGYANTASVTSTQVTTPVVSNTVNVTVTVPVGAGSVSGTISETGSGTPIAGATVAVTAGNTTTTAAGTAAAII